MPNNIYFEASMMNINNTETTETKDMLFEPTPPWIK